MAGGKIERQQDGSIKIIKRVGTKGSNILLELLKVCPEDNLPQKFESFNQQPIEELTVAQWEKVYKGWNLEEYDFHYYSAEGASWYFVRMTSDECFDYYGYDYNAVALIEQVISRLPDSHPLRLLPDVVRYVWGMTANLRQPVLVQKLI